MNGRVLEYSVQTNSGAITGDDGNRYSFTGAEWKDQANPARGMRVDFDTDGRSAIGVYCALGTSSTGVASRSKDKMAAGLLAVFVGELGIHKFYLGYTKPAVIMLAITLGGFVLAAAIVGELMGVFVFIAMKLIGLAESMIYLAKSDKEFERIYVTEQKHWF